MRTPTLLFALLFPGLAAAQYMGNLPDPVLMFASFAKELAVCEAAQPTFQGETAKYLHAVDGIAPGHLKSSEIDVFAAELVRKARDKDLSKVTETQCREDVLPISSKALSALPCYRDRDWKECPAIK
jgi:hypothetical protein